MKSVKSKPVVSNEVLELDSEEMLPEVPLEKVIESALVKANVTDQVISALKEKYGSLRLKSIDDKESYLEVKEGRKEVRKVGIITEKICKKGREDAVAIQKKWLAKEKEILEKISDVEDPLNAEIEKFENEVSRKEQEEQKRKEEFYINRQSTLLKLGAGYNNGSFELQHISYEVELIKNSDDEQWNDTILPKYKRVYDEIEAARVEEENKRKEEMERQRKEKEAFELEQKKFREEQELFAKQQRELQQHKDEHERRQREEQERKYNEEKQKRQSIINDRINQLRSLGLNYSVQYDSYVFEDVAISRVVEIEGMDNEKWDELILKVTPTIERNKKELEEKRQAQIEKEKQAAIELAAQQEREKIAEEQRQAEIKKQQEEQRKQQEIESAKDKEKYARVVEYLKHCPQFIMTSTMYKGKMNIINDFINDL